MNKFPPGVGERLKWYVYRLIDPRNGETFYVGKGQNDRVFDHANHKLALGAEEAADLKYRRIKEIRALGLEVGHVIHRHGIESATTAYQIEAALMDAYPGLANRVGGHGGEEYGLRHAAEIIADYTAEEFVPKERLILININRSYADESLTLYAAVRGAWKLSAKRAQEYKLVLAHHGGLVRGAFRPTRWVPGTSEDFPWLEKLEGRYAFEGDPAEEEVRRLYERKRVPERYRPKGSSNPIRFIEPA
jgi:hypothetical protein